MVLSNIWLRVLACGAAVVLLSGAPTLAHAITLTHFEMVSPEGDDDGLMPIGAKGATGERP